MWLQIINQQYNLHLYQWLVFLFGLFVSVMSHKDS
jgi:hypothetical protein